MTSTVSWPKGYCREHFLADLVQRENLKRVAELGVWKGRTFLHLLVHCPGVEVIGVDAWEYHPERAGVPGGETYEAWNMPGLEKHVRKAAKPFGSRAVILKMDTAAAATKVKDSSLDLVFIDADHSAEGVTRDLNAWVPKVKQGGFITGHDIDWETVRQVVAARYPHYAIGPDNVWWVRND